MWLIKQKKTQTVEKHWSMVYASGSQLMGRYYAKSVISLRNGSPDSILYCFLGQQLPKVENHWSTSVTSFITKYKYVEKGINYSLVTRIFSMG